MRRRLRTCDGIPASCAVFYISSVAINVLLVLRGTHNHEPRRRPGTIKVITVGSAPTVPSTLPRAGRFRLGEFVRQRGSDAVARHIQRRAVELVSVADDRN